MIVLPLLPVFLSALVLAAHFLRAGSLVPMALALATPFLLLVPRPWAARTVQAGLLVGAVIWLRALTGFVHYRQAMGQPWTRLAVILGAVALFTAASALVFGIPVVRRRYFPRAGETG